MVSIMNTEVYSTVPDFISQVNYWTGDATLTNNIAYSKYIKILIFNDTKGNPSQYVHS